MTKVTGVDLAVQTVLTTQTETAVVLMEATRRIETEDLTDFAFVSLHATHRSCGCALLLAMLIFREAAIVLATRRTRTEAQVAGMLEVRRH